jgi:hypothetical protein
MSKFIMPIIFLISFNIYSQNKIKTYKCYSINLFMILPDSSLELISKENEETTFAVNNKTILIQGKNEGEEYIQQWNISSAKQEDEAFIINTTDPSGEDGDTFMFYNDHILRFMFVKTMNKNVVISYYFK